MLGRPGSGTVGGMDAAGPPIAALAARDGLARVYLQVFRYVAERAAEGDRVAAGIERELRTPALPAPTHAQVRRWLASVAAEPRRIVNRRADPFIARDLINLMNAAEARAGALGPQTWVQVVFRLRGTPVSGSGAPGAPGGTGAPPR